jgi:hypothetical protein
MCRLYILIFLIDEDINLFKNANFTIGNKYKEAIFCYFPSLYRKILFIYLK